MQYLYQLLIKYLRNINLVDKLIRNDMRIDYIIHSMDQEYKSISKTSNDNHKSGARGLLHNLSSMRKMDRDPDHHERKDE